MPDISKLPELADLFGITIDELLGRSAPLVSSAAQRQLEKHLQEATVTAGEAAEAAPLLMPGQVDQIAGRLLKQGQDAAASVHGDSVAVGALLPFMSTSLIASLAAQSSDVSRFLPFMRTRAVDALALERLSKGEDERPLFPLSAAASLTASPMPA